MGTPTTNGYFYKPDLGASGTDEKTAFDAALDAADAAIAASLVGAPADFTVPAANSIYFGPADTNGSWRINISGNDLQIQKKESGVWVEKFSITA